MLYPQADLGAVTTGWRADSEDSTVPIAPSPHGPASPFRGIRRLSASTLGPKARIAACFPPRFSSHTIPVLTLGPSPPDGGPEARTPGSPSPQGPASPFRGIRRLSA